MTAARWLPLPDGARLGRKLARVKATFFDRPAVQDALDRRARKALSRFGAFVRRRAQTSMRRRKASSRPGEPPSSHEGSLRRFLFFAFDPATGGVVIGPAATNQIFARGDRRLTRGTVPEVLERGGTVEVFEVDRGGGDWVRADLRSPRRLDGRPQRWRPYAVAARPYMRPAFAAELRFAGVYLAAAA